MPLDEFFESSIQIPRMQIGKQQTIETLINEEALILAKYLRNELNTWTPRVPLVCISSKTLAE